MKNIEETWETWKTWKTWFAEITFNGNRKHTETISRVTKPLWTVDAFWDGLWMSHNGYFVTCKLPSLIRSVQCLYRIKLQARSIGDVYFEFHFRRQLDIVKIRRFFSKKHSSSTTRLLCKGQKGERSRYKNKNRTKPTQHHNHCRGAQKQTTVCFLWDDWNIAKV